MKERMKEPYEKGLANHSAPSFAPHSVRGEAKRKQGIGGLGIELRKDVIRMLTPYTVAESHMDGNDNASPRTILRSRRPQSTPINFMHGSMSARTYSQCSQLRNISITLFDPE